MQRKYRDSNPRKPNNEPAPPCMSEAYNRPYPCAAPDCEHCQDRTFPAGSWPHTAARAA